MSAFVPYADIPKDERQRLAKDAYREEPVIRIILFAGIMGSIVFSDIVVRYVVSRHGPMTLPKHLGLRLAAALFFTGIVWESFGRRRLKAAVEKLKNSR